MADIQNNSESKFFYSEKQAAFQQRMGHPTRFFDKGDGVKRPYTEIIQDPSDLKRRQEAYPDGMVVGTKTPETKMIIERPQSNRYQLGQ